MTTREVILTREIFVAHVVRISPIVDSSISSIVSKMTVSKASRENSCIRYESLTHRLKSLVLNTYYLKDG